MTTKLCTEVAETTGNDNGTLLSKASSWCFKFSVYINTILSEKRSMTTVHRSRWGGRRRGRRAAMPLSASTPDAFAAAMFVVLFVVVSLTVVVEKNDSPSSFTAASALQTTSRVLLNLGPTKTTTRTTAVALNLGPMDDLSEYGKNKQRSELDNLTSKREAIKRAKLANIKPNDNEPRLPLTANDNDDNDDDNISRDELQQLLQRLQKEKEDREEEDDLFAMPEFKTKRIVNNQQRGLSSGNYGADTTSSNSSSNNNNNVSGSKKASSNDENDANGNNNATTEDEEEDNNNIFIDWTTDYNDENELHIPNRIGITTRHWGNVKLGYVDGKKLKKKDRAVGRYNKNDLKVR